MKTLRILQISYRLQVNFDGKIKVRIQKRKLFNNKVLNICFWCGLEKAYFAAGRMWIRMIERTQN